MMDWIAVKAGKRGRGQREIVEKRNQKTHQSLLILHCQECSNKECLVKRINANFRSMNIYSGNECLINKLEYY